MLQESALNWAGAVDDLLQVVACHVMNRNKGIGTDEWSGNQEGSLAFGGSSLSPRPASVSSLHIQPICTRLMKPTIGIRLKGLFVTPMGCQAAIRKY